ncbi:MAG: hypothetical protein C4547_07375 [Phycisphaerales bacterium]|nr:MAG: hypothetical protein C4547_07375 [Phycisphaerales bacterium]
MGPRWRTFLWLGLLGACTVTACAGLALTAVARTSRLQERWLVGDGPHSVPRLGYTDDGVLRAGVSVPFGGTPRSKQWHWHQTGAALTCASTSLHGDRYLCDRYTLALSAPFPLLTSLSAILPVFAFLNGPATRYVRRRLGRCPHCGRLPADAAPPCPKCEVAEHAPGSAHRP